VFSVLSADEDLEPGNALRRISRKKLPSSALCLDPLQCGDLIEQPVIPRNAPRRFSRECRVKEEAQHPQSVVERDHNDAAASQSRAIILGSGPRRPKEATSINP
jgi:hypothetical protein